jgi:hypothetical protein
MRRCHILAIVAVTALSVKAEAKDLYCLVYNGNALLGTPIHVASVETCKGIAEAAQHAGLRGASFKFSCRDKESWSDSQANATAADPVVSSCH